MIFFRIPERRRRFLIPLITLGLAAYYFLVFLPLGHRSAELDQPLEQTGRDLAFALGKTNLPVLDAPAIAHQLQQTEQSLAALQATVHQAGQRLQLSADVQARMRAQFQLVDYQYERQIEMDDLGRLAAKHKVKLEPAVLAGFPEHTADVKNPWLLWAKLELLHHLLTTAVDNQVTAVHALRVSSRRTEPARAESTRKLIAVPLDLELTGSMTNVTRFLRSLPLRAEELKAAGLPEAAASKPPLFIDRLLMLKHAPGQPDEVSLSLQVTGFVPREDEGIYPSH